MTLTEETAKELNENLIRVLKVLAPKKAKKKTKKDQMIEKETERLYKKWYSKA